MYDFAIGQVAYYKRQNEYVEKFLSFCNRELARSRKEDAEMKEYALSTQPDDELTQRIFGGDYVSSDTRKLLAERAKYYRERKRNNERIQHYTKEAERYARLM